MRLISVFVGVSPSRARPDALEGMWEKRLLIIENYAKSVITVHPGVGLNECGINRLIAAG